MTKTQLIKVTKDLGLDYYNACENYICIKGINSHVQNLNTDAGIKQCNYLKVATLLDFAEHLKQMGRDSLKMELNSLLDITRHH
ncbi:MAG: hypothetical protein LH629_06025 [Ignavibacteria bacterium]|nr:hypothetical protein [Ignavibacteria bacterium]